MILIWFILQIDSEFGGSLIPCGDLDGDGFVEIAIGAPQADGGRGKLTLYNLYS